MPTTSTEPRTTTELMAQAAAALEQRDHQLILRLQQISEGWLQPADEAAAQRALLEQIEEAIYTLKDLAL